MLTMFLQKYQAERKREEEGRKLGEKKVENVVD